VTITNLYTGLLGSLALVTPPKPIHVSLIELDLSFTADQKLIASYAVWILQLFYVMKHAFEWLNGQFM